MSEAHSAGKGTNRRAYKTNEWNDNYDRIFRNEVKKVYDLCNDCDCQTDPDHDSHDETIYNHNTQKL
jgi:hypothetical protein